MIKREYLDSTSINVAAGIMKLISQAIGFEVVELWCRSADNSSLHCAYCFVDGPTHKKYPNLISGYHPDREDDHQLSQSVRRYFRLAFSCFLVSVSC